MSKLFREKNLERISSPEQLNDYIRVSTPSVWLLLAAIIVLLVGVCVWGIFGRMDTTVRTVAVSQDGAVVIYVQEADAGKIKESAVVEIDGSSMQIKAIADYPVTVDETFSDYAIRVGGFQDGDWVYAVQLDGACPDGVYEAQIVIDSVSPMSFVLN